MFKIDVDSAFGQRALARLQAEEIVWLITVDGKGTPQPSPVWFLWDDGSMLIYSQPNTPKLRNLVRHPRCTMHFNTDTYGDNVVVLLGTASVDTSAPRAADVPDYFAKYQRGLSSLGMTSEQFAADYSVAICFQPERLRGF
ncbi:hypothetical protein BH23CHL5_BH23CHL5_24020 [soil metagenome]